ncbi:MAG: Na/Pi symporter, partial [bacterium]|nr:Na/Pi symporter [bacterium]
FAKLSLQSNLPVLGPLLGIFTGAIFTVLFQSSSATVGLTIALASAGIIDIYVAIPLIFGENIGTTITALIASAGTNITAKRAAIAHTLFNVIGVAIMYFLFFLKVEGNPVFLVMIDKITPGNMFTGENIERHIANSHSLFNILNTILFIPLLGILAFFTKKIIKGEETGIVFKLKYIDERFAENTAIAIPQAEKEVERMLEIALDMLRKSVKAFLDNDTKELNDIQRRERLLDHLQSDITHFLVKVSGTENLTEEEIEILPVLMHTINDIERIGDHCINIIELIDLRMDKKICFTNRAQDEMNEMYGTLTKMYEQSMIALHKIDKQLARKNLDYEEKLNNLLLAFRISHMDRLNHGECSADAGFIFLDFILNLEKIGDHLTNINQAILGELQWNKGKK